MSDEIWGGNPEVQESNLEVFKKEAVFALELSSKIPTSPVEQDQRSKNRFREHSGEGHGLFSLGHTSHHQPNHTMHQCSCGWVGWLIPKADE